MPPFDIIETVGKAYIRFWQERHYLLKLAFLPFLTKALFFGIVLLFGLNENILRQTLIMLPAFFFEGWMMAHIARLIFMEERWPVKLSGHLEKEMVFLERRGRALFASILIFVLIKMVQSAIAAPVIFFEGQIEDISQQSQPSVMAFFVVCLILLFLIWMFKFAFLYIPVAGNVRIIDYVRRFSGVNSSLYFLGAWLVCSMPFFLGASFVIALLNPLSELAPNFIEFGFYVFYFSIDLAAGSVVTICIALGIKEAFSKPINDNRKGPGL